MSNKKKLLFFRVANYWSSAAVGWWVSASQDGLTGTQTHAAATIVPPENKCRAWFPCWNTQGQRKGSRLFALWLRGMYTFRFVKFTCFDFPTAGLHPSIPPPKKEIFCPRHSAPPHTGCLDSCLHHLKPRKKPGLIQRSPWNLLYENQNENNFWLY